MRQGEFASHQSETIRLHGDGVPYAWPHTLQRSSEGTVAFEITAATNRTVVVEASTDLKSGSWTPLTTFAPAVQRATIEFSDLEAGKFQKRFYRAISR